MTPMQLGQEIISASYDRRHDDVHRFVGRLVAMAQATIERPPTQPEPQPSNPTLEPSD